MNDYGITLNYHSGQDQLFFQSKAKIKVIAKGRRWGLTKGYANYVIERMLSDVKLALWVDTVNSNIDRYVERYFLPTLSKLPSDIWQWRQQRKELTIGDAKCDLRSADRPELIEGFAYQLILLNEAGIILNNRYLWENTILPMSMDYNADIIIGGTPKGCNLFYELHARAGSGKADPKYKHWEAFHFTSYDSKYQDKEKIDELADNMPELVRRQEIYAEFLSDVAGVFKNVDRCLGSVAQPPVKGNRYFMGVDLAKYVDFTVIDILNQNGSQVYFNRLHQQEWAYQKRLIADIAQQYGALVYIDSTGVGDPIYEDLQRESINIRGIKFDSARKKQVIESLMLSIEQQKISLLREQVQTDELKMFTYDISPSGIIRYSAPEGLHDDCVIALALANYARETGGATSEVIWI